ncbi:MAG: zinc ribbon domain-containing protein [Clostridia bacterium]|nr:zinc ribbon domain-containing protein [Clostridia bacterium]
MAFCQNCGAPLAEGEKFCSSCGSAVIGSVPVVPVAPQIMSQQSLFEQQQKARQDSINELAKMISYFGQKADLFREYELSHNRLAVLQRGASKVPLVIGIILIAFFGFLDVMFCWALVEASAPLMVVLVMASILGVFVILGIILIIVFIVKKSSNSRNLTAERTKVTDIAYELTNYYTNYGFCSLGIEYCNPAILVKIADIIRSGRAANPQEAVNTLLADNRKSAMQLQKKLGSLAARQEVRNGSPAAAFTPSNFFR